MENSLYEIQHFNFSVAELRTDRDFLVRQLLSIALESIIKKVTKDEQTKELLKDKLPHVHQEMLAALEAHMQQLSELDAKYFTIPPNVLLPIDVDFKNNYTAETEQAAQRDLEKVKQQYFENLVMLKMLNAQNTKYQQMKTFLAEETDLQEQVKKALLEIDMHKLQEMVDSALKLE